MSKLCDIFCTCYTKWPWIYLRLTTLQHVCISGFVGDGDVMFSQYNHQNQSDDVIFCLARQVAAPWKKSAIQTAFIFYEQAILA